MHPTTNAVVRTFALYQRLQKHPEQLRTVLPEWFTEAFGNDLGPHLLDKLNPEDIAHWFANLDDKNREIFLTHKRFS